MEKQRISTEIAAGHVDLARNFLERSKSYDKTLSGTAGGFLLANQCRVAPSLTPAGRQRIIATIALDINATAGER